MDDYTGAGAADRDFAELYRREFPRAAALARSLCGSWAVAEEITQDAFLVAHRRWSHVRALDDPGQWVRRIVANRAVSSFRRSQAERRALRRAGPGDATVDPPGPAGGMLDRIAELPRRQAQAVAAVYVDQLSIAEAARFLDCSASTLRTHLQRGRVALREMHVAMEAGR
jgi:DNA-directed RNA polymerase specialized sigma24 family protein